LIARHLRVFTTNLRANYSNFMAFRIQSTGSAKGESMSIEEVSAEKLAELFHHYHRILGCHHNGTTGVDAQGWEQMPPQERSRLVAAARLTLLELTSTVRKEEHGRRYFAKPGEAEWGC
jgi:hypothetical protein